MPEINESDDSNYGNGGYDDEFFHYLFLESVHIYEAMISEVIDFGFSIFYRYFSVREELYSLRVSNTFLLKDSFGE